MSTTDPKTISKNARRVASQHEDHERAVDVEEDAYCGLLAAVLEAAHPALPALSSQVPDRPERGLLLVRGEDGDVWWIESDADPLCPKLVAFAALREDTSPKGIATSYGRRAVVDSIMAVSVALDAQLRGGKHKATEKILRRAEQVRALATLVKGLS